jgi:type II secretory pathway component PulM
MKTLSARDRVKYSAVLWIVMIFLSILTFFLVVNPLVQERSEKQKVITTSQKKLESLEEEKDRLSIQMKEIKNIFEKAAGETLINEQKILPKSINTDHITQALELFSLEINNFDITGNSVLDLTGINFSNSKPHETLAVTETPATMSFDATHENIPKMLTFIQKGKLPEDYEKQAEANSSLINRDNYQFIKKHGVPIGTIKQIQTNLKKNNREKSDQEIFTVKIQAIFYSEN